MFLKLKSCFTNIFENFLNLIYNKKCLICSCSKTDDLLCKNCLKDVRFLSCFPHRIYRDISIYSALLYEGSVKKLIQLLKFSHRKSSSKVLASLLYSYFKKLNLNEDYIIIYPPSYFLKTAQKGYEHMFLIAREFSKYTGFKIEKNLIKKIKYTIPQYKAKNRIQNIKNSFKINQKYIDKYKNKNIILLDDITTSGATINEILDCLINEGFKKIICLTISKVQK